MQLQHLVLLGGGHSHLFVVKAFGMNPLRNVQITMVTKDVHTPYSGMIPGYVAGHYSLDECHIDLAKLASFAGVRLVHATCCGIDTQRRQLKFPSRPPIQYDVLSIDTGSAPQLPEGDSAQFVTAVKPIDGFVSRVDALLSRVHLLSETFTIVVVGGGAGGVEVAFALHHRLTTSLASQPGTASSASNAVKPGTEAAQEPGQGPNAKFRIKIVTRGKLLGTHPPRARRLALGVADRMGIEVLEESRVAEVKKGALVLQSGSSVRFDECLWCAQAAPASWLEHVDLPKADDGFLAINEFLQSAGGPPEVFAAGDVATSVKHPRPKAGVYAVRQGTPLAENLRLALVGGDLVPFKPQTTNLALISCGGRHAIASWKGTVFSGDWVWNSKDHIDRAFMRKFSSELPTMSVAAGPAPAVLNKSDKEAVALWEHSAMPCQGCGAKVPPSTLTRILQRLNGGVEGAAGLQGGSAVVLDDAAELPAAPEGRKLLQTVDSVNAFVTDLFLFGRIAAVHALSDCYAMGAKPLAAVVAAQAERATRGIQEDQLLQMMAGVQQELTRANCALLGGHSSQGSEPALTLTVTCHAAPDELLKKGGLRAGQQLVLTKPLGTGVLLRGAMLGQAKWRWQRQCWDNMLQSNAAASELFARRGLSACTDVSGFGLLGHAVEMAAASKVRVELAAGRLPCLPGAEELVQEDVRSTAHTSNLFYLDFVSNADSAAAAKSFPLLTDPQTSGGLLVGVDKAAAAEMVAELRKLGYDQATVVGECHSLRDLDDGKYVRIVTDAAVGSAAPQ